MGYIELKNNDWKVLTRALQTSFGVMRLNALVTQNFPKVAGDVAWLGVGLSDVVFQVVDVSNKYGVLDQLIAAVAAEREDRPDLRALQLYFGQRPGWKAPLHADDLEIGSTLELLTSSGDPFLDTTRLALWLIQVERQVCQVRCGSDHGTGFLIAPDLVLTCFHVVERHLRKSVPASEVQVRFDYRRKPNGAEPPYEVGTWLGIDPAWSIPNSPYSPVDKTLIGDPQPDELDFAVLRLGRCVGEEKPPDEDYSRGWIDLSGSLPLPPPASPMLIVQHPGTGQNYPPQRPLKITFATPGFDKLNANETRIIYMPSTLKGSSGSPVFDSTLCAVGLHHNRGQLNPDAAHLAKNNRGIPLGKIRDALSSEVRTLLQPPPNAFPE